MHFPHKDMKGIMNKQLKYQQQQINKIITTKMDSPKLSFDRFQTVSYTHKNNKNLTPRTHLKFTRSGHLNEQSTLNTTLGAYQTPIRDVSLPSITEKKKKKKRGGFLETWLDEALGGPDPQKGEEAEIKQSQVQNGVLKTIKKFCLDKRYLQSQNIPAEKVDKLYKSLYIYTHGLNQVFRELLEFIQEYENAELLGNFWKAYTKLLEGCTSYQTAFQRIEGDHLSNIQKLRQKITQNYSSYEEEKKKQQALIEKLQKDNEGKTMKIEAMREEFKVMESTLGLTDEAFNEEVHLRLKFQEKINAIYTSYEELKSKYEKLVEEMRLKNDNIQQRDNQFNKLKNQLLAEKTRCKQLIFLLENQKKKVSDREAQILIKKTEMEELKESLQGKENKEEEALEAMETQISKQKSLQVQLIEAKNIIAGQKMTFKQQEEQINKLNKLMEDLKIVNNEIYQKHSMAGRIIASHEISIAKKEQKIKELDECLNSKVEEASDLSREIEHVRKQRDGLRTDLQETTFNLKKSEELNKNNAVTIKQMKSVKHKFEEINKILQKELWSIERLYNDQQNQISLKTQEIQGLKMILESKNKTVSQMEKQIEQERQTQKVKISALNSTINKKESILLEYQKAKQKYLEDESKDKVRIERLNEKVALVESEKLKCEILLAGKVSQIQELQSLLTDRSQKMRVVNEKYESLLKEKQTIGSKLNSTQYVIQSKNEEQNIQILTLNNLIAEYREVMAKKSQHIHPMAYEDQECLAFRAQENEKKWKNQLAIIKEEAERFILEKKILEQKIQDLFQKNEKQKNERTIITTEKQKMSEELKKQKVELKKNQQSMGELSRKIKKMEEINKDAELKVKSLEGKIQFSEMNIKELKEKNKKLQKKSKTTHKKEEQLSISKAHEELTLSGRKKEQEKPKIETKQNWMQTQEQKEQVLIVEKIDNETQTVDVEEKISSENDEEKSEKMEPMIMRKEQPRRIEGKDFKRALKLTYMRR